MHRCNVNLSKPSLLYNSANGDVDKLNFAQRTAPPYTKYRAPQAREAYCSLSTLGSFLVFFSISFSANRWIVREAVAAAPPVHPKISGRIYSALRLKFFADIWNSSAFRGICMRF